MKATPTLLLLLLLNTTASAFQVSQPSISVRSITQQRPLPSSPPQRKTSTRLHGVVRTILTPPKKSGGSLVLAGRLASTLSKLAIGPTKAKAVAAAVTDAIHIGDLALIGILGWGILPLVEFIYKKRHPEISDKVVSNEPYYKAADWMSQIAKIGGIVYTADILGVALKMVGFQIPLDMSSVVAKISYFAWAAYQVAHVKQKLLMRAVRVRNPDQLGKNRIYDRVGNVLLMAATIMWMLDVLSVETGRAVGSIFALGSVGTLVLSLASRDVAAQLVSGLALTASRRFYEGEEIELGDGTRGSVAKMGWLYTDMRGE